MGKTVKFSKTTLKYPFTQITNIYALLCELLLITNVILFSLPFTEPPLKQFGPPALDRARPAVYFFHIYRWYSYESGVDLLVWLSATKRTSVFPEQVRLFLNTCSSGCCCWALNHPQTVLSLLLSIFSDVKQVLDVNLGSRCSLSNSHCSPPLLDLGLWHHCAFFLFVCLFFNLFSETCKIHPERDTSLTFTTLCMWLVFRTNPSQRKCNN